MILHFQVGELYVNKTVLLPVSLCTLLSMALHSTAMQSSVLTVTHTDTAQCKTAHS
ncbi:unnamed protein product [Staurois parvus]|uniref:Uncharacterized protein n=1 Tax=Staurois parvus TaxID=386267 RepID=A0ABN9BGE4_9NEOB|nr:unnamed protein product [Staurois parvus]CAI9600085.1 unnamed protein product [Staurois parvus]